MYTILFEYLINDEFEYIPGTFNILHENVLENLLGKHYFYR